MPATCWPIPQPHVRMAELEFRLLDAATFDDIPEPAQPDEERPAYGAGIQGER